MKQYTHVIEFYEAESNSATPQQYAREPFTSAHEAHKRFTQAVKASLTPAAPMRIIWKDHRGQKVAEYSVFITL